MKVIQRIVRPMLVIVCVLGLVACAHPRHHGGGNGGGNDGGKSGGHSQHA